jgi:hypothetical protein
VRQWLALAIVVVLGGCAHARSQHPSPAESDWRATLAEAQQFAKNAQVASADSVLAEYIARAPESAGARDAAFWRGVFALDPADSSGGPKAAVAAFDQYLADSASRPYRVEALTLRRTAQTMDSLASARAAEHIPKVHLVVADDSLRASAREQELQKALRRLQDSLDKTTTELDRIKKRLTAHKP